MLFLAWNLSSIAHSLHSHLENDIMDIPMNHSLYSSIQPDEEWIMEDYVNHSEFMKRITNDILDSIVCSVIHNCYERDVIIDSTLSNIVDIFVDSIEGEKEHSFEDDLVIQEVTDELIDGIINVISQPISEIQPLAHSEDQLSIQETLNSCKEVILAISFVIMVINKYSKLKNRKVKD